ncbi:lipoprotein insertase outer membrane protein LolB [Candidatus Pantoea carbekii]|uniref:lipoprotein insertase outer membrane protein LolB n=1 Tax=Candidatus Pantoea carbekii TaxID=1235990 RepID=UPI000618752E|nr:lipoprotein insertase outer membrane protein LolB [Candidatus Pantoea carbekii]AKC32034.1 outer-membrane lipoprotein LolB precursor [Candidatus Pantoea carbekii]
MNFSFRNTLLLKLLILVYVPLMTACSINNKIQYSSIITNSLQWKNHEKAIENITHYQTQGLVIYISDSKKFYVRFKWHQISPNHYHLSLINVLGITELQIEKQGSTVKIIDNKGIHYIGNNAEKMIRGLIGINIPLNNLSKWILGLPDHCAQYYLNQDNRLESFRYNHSNQHWKVYIEHYNNKMIPALPSNIEFIEGNRHIKLCIDKWDILK